MSASSITVPCVEPRLEVVVPIPSGRPYLAGFVPFVLAIGTESIALGVFVPGMLRFMYPLLAFGPFAGAL